MTLSGVIIRTATQKGNPPYESPEEARSYFVFVPVAYAASASSSLGVSTVALTFRRNICTVLRIPTF